MERRAKVNACRELAVRSGRYISFDPERWGEHKLDSMEICLSEFLSKLPEEVRDEYEDRYIEKYKAWLSAMSRCFSQAITGAGGWDARVMRRHEKTNAAEQNAFNRLNEWCEKVIRRCNRQQRLTGWAEVERLQEKLDGLRENKEKMKAANKIIRDKKLAEIEKVDELVALGFFEQDALKLMEPDFCGRIGFPSYALQNNNARIKDTEAKLKRHTAMAERAAQGDEVHEFPWGKCTVAFGDERYRFEFNNIPDEDVRRLLKEYGFKWSRRNNAWQRQITPNSKYVVKNIILPKLNGTAK